MPNLDKFGKKPEIQCSKHQFCATKFLRIQGVKQQEREAKELEDGALERQRGSSGSEQRFVPPRQAPTIRQPAPESARAARRAPMTSHVRQLITSDDYPRSITIGVRACDATGAADTKWPVALPSSRPPGRDV